MRIEISRDELKRRGLMVGTPCYGGFLTVPYHLASLRLANRFRDLEIPLKTCMLENESLVTRARNNIVKMFWHDPQVNHLLFIDADICFEPDDVLSLLALNDKYPIICGIYPKKRINWDNIKKAVEQGVPAHELKNYMGDLVLNLIPNEQGQIVINLDQPVEVLDAGTGFMMINKKVIGEMIKAYPETKYIQDYYINEEMEKYKNEGIYALFDCILSEWPNGQYPGEKRYLSEDYAFLLRARKLGIPTYILPSINLLHSGSHHYVGNVRSVLSLHSEQAKPQDVINPVETA